MVQRIDPTYSSVKLEDGELKGLKSGSEEWASLPFTPQQYITLAVLLKLEKEQGATDLVLVLIGVKGILEQGLQQIVDAKMNQYAASSQVVALQMI